MRLRRAPPPNPAIRLTRPVALSPAAPALVTPEADGANVRGPRATVDGDLTVRELVTGLTLSVSGPSHHHGVDKVLPSLAESDQEDGVRVDGDVDRILFKQRWAAVLFFDSGCKKVLKSGERECG